jgi:hypothetical protein
MKEKITIYDYLRALTLKEDIDYDPKIAPAAILCLWLSLDERLIEYVEPLLPYLHKMPDKMIYRYLFLKIPTGKVFLKWIPKKKKDDRIQALMEKYNISEMEARKYV